MPNLNAINNNMINTENTPLSLGEVLKNEVIAEKIFSFLDGEDGKSFMQINKDVYFNLNDRINYPERAKKTARKLAGNLYSKSEKELVSFFHNLGEKQEDFACKALVELQNSLMS